MIEDHLPVHFFRPLYRGCLLLTLVTMASCVAPKPSQPETPKERPLYVWDVEKAAKIKGKPSIVIDLTQQKATYYRDNKEVGWTTVATGTFKHPTPTGNFKVLEKTINKVSNLYGKMLDKDGNVVVSDAKMGETPIPEGGRFDGAKMQYFMRFTYDGVGMHIGPIPRPGYRASHGCIRTPRIMAERFYEITPLGTPVTIMESPRPKPDPKQSASSDKTPASKTTR